MHGPSTPYRRGIRRRPNTGRSYIVLGPAPAPMESFLKVVAAGRAEVGETSLGPLGDCAMHAAVLGRPRRLEQRWNGGTELADDLAFIGHEDADEQRLVQWSRRRKAPQCVVTRKLLKTNSTGTIG